MKARKKASKQERKKEKKKRRMKARKKARKKKRKHTVNVNFDVHLFAKECASAYRRNHNDDIHNQNSYLSPRPAMLSLFELIISIRESSSSYKFSNSFIFATYIFC